MIKGIDLSHHNGQVNFNAVKAAGIQFVYLKATEGVTYTDTMFFQNVRAAKAANLLVGAYHFAHSSNDSDYETNNFISALRQVPALDLLPVLDLEVTDNQTASHLQAFAQHFVSHMQNKIGLKTMLYTGEYFYNTYLKGLNGPLWIAKYGPEPSIAYDVWQNSESGVVSGVSGQCDTNICRDINSILIKPYSVQTGVVTCLTNLNLRDKPSTEGNVIKVLPKGSQWKTFGNINGWYNLGENQWCSGNSQYVSFAAK
jgi:GH25 family lysozyme M1 (1,4-beta-N-acetylmuramidase)